MRVRWTITGREGPIGLAVEPALVADYRERAVGSAWVVDVVASVEPGASRFAWRGPDGVLLSQAYFDARLPRGAPPLLVASVRLDLPAGWTGELLPRAGSDASPLPVAGAALSRNGAVGPLEAGDHAFILADFAGASASVRAKLPAIASVLAAANGRLDGGTRLLGLVPEGASRASERSALVAGAGDLGVVAHEVAHLFQEHGVRAPPDGGLWLVEGAAEYQRLVALVAAGAIGGKAASLALDAAWRSLPEDAPPLRDMDFSCCRAGVYAKGATTLAGVDAALARTGDPFACVAGFFASLGDAKVGSSDFLAWAARSGAYRTAAAGVDERGAGPAPAFDARPCLVAFPGDPVGAPGFAHVRVANAGSAPWRGTLALGPAADAGGSRLILPGESVIAAFPLAGEARDARVRALEAPERAAPEATAVASVARVPFVMGAPALLEGVAALAFAALAIAVVARRRA